MQQNDKGAGAIKRSPRIERPYPRETLEEAVKVPLAIRRKNGGNPCPPAEVAATVERELTTNAFFYLTTASRDFGLTAGTRDTAKLELLELGRRLAYAETWDEERRAKCEAFMSVQIFKDVIEYYKGSNLPEMKHLTNTLEGKFGLDPRIHREFTDLFRKNCEYLNITEGISQNDIGRSDEGSAHGKEAVAAPSNFVTTPVPDGDYQCVKCENVFDNVWNCKECGALICDSCSKGGESTQTGIAARVVGALYTLGISEVARAGYRTFNQSCPKCSSSDLVGMEGKPSGEWKSNLNEIKELAQRTIHARKSESDGATTKSEDKIRTRVVMDMESDLERVVAESEEVHVAKGTKITIKRSRKIERTINVDFRIAGTANVDIGITKILKTAISGEIERKQGKTYLESEVKEYQIELNGEDSTHFKLEWSDLWRVGKVEFIQEDNVRKVPFRIRRGTELKITPITVSS